MADVQDIPRYPTGQVVPITWAEGGTATEPLAGRKATGFQPADVVTEAEINWLSREPMRVIRALYSRFPNASEQFFGSWFPPIDCGIWQDAVNPLDVYLTDSGLVASVVADVWVDPPDVDTGAVRVQVSVPLAFPQTLQPNRTTYVYVPNTMITPPTVTTAELTFLDVPLNDPAPAEPAGTTLVWFIDTDGVGITDQGILLLTYPVLKTVGIMSLFATMMSIENDLDIGGDLNVAGNSNLGNAISDTTTISGSAVIGNYVFAYDDVIAVGDLVANYGNLFVGVDATIGGVLLSQLGIESGDYLNAPGNVTLCNGAGVKTLTVGSDSSDVLTCNSAASLLSNVNLSTGTGVFTCTVGSSTADTLTINATVSSFNFGANTITGSGGTVSCTTVTATTVGTEEIRFQDSVTTLPSVAGRVRWNNTFFSFFDSTSVARTFDEPVRGFDAQLATAANPLTDTTASATRRVKHNEPVWIEMGSRVETDTGGSNANYQLRITGPLGTADVFTSAIVMATAAKGYVWQEYFYWTPTDSFGAETDPENYVFLVRMGTSAGNLTADRIGIKVSSAIQV